jgi:hypothetical protein
LRSQGSIRTSKYFSTAPFAGAAISLLVFHRVPDILFLAALLLMLAGMFLLERETYAHLHGMYVSCTSTTTSVMIGINRILMSASRKMGRALHRRWPIGIIQRMKK